MVQTNLVKKRPLKIKDYLFVIDSPSRAAASFGLLSSAF